MDSIISSFDVIIEFSGKEEINMKKLFSLLCAGVMAIGVLATSVSAIDYFDPTSYSYPQIATAFSAVGMPVGTSTGAVVSGEKVATRVVSAASINDAITSGKVISVSRATAVLSKSAVAAMIESGKKVTFAVKGARVTIDPATITDPTAVIDVATKVSTTKGNSFLGNVPVPAGTKVIKLSTKKAIGCEMTITVNCGDIDAANAKFYAVLATGEVVELGPVVDNGNGKMSITISKNCTYFITDKSVGK